MMSSRTPSRCAILWLAAALSAGLSAQPATGQDTVALLEDFIVGDEAPEEAQLADLTIVRADSQQDPGRRGLLLAAGDEVRTGPGCRAMLRFLAPEGEVQPLLIVDVSSTVRIENPSSVQAILGRLFATLKGFFTVVTSTGQLGVKGTEFEVTVDGDGSLEEVRVLEGVVDLSDAPGAPESLEIRPLERLAVTGAGDRPESMEEAEVRTALGWTNDVWVQAQPSWAAPGDPPRFATVEDRAKAFRDARFRAIWSDEPAAKAELGDIFNDWGEGSRAIVAYGDAAAAEPERKESADFLANLSQANRRAGRLAEAETLATEAVKRRPDSGRAHLALGNVLTDRAKFGARDQDPTTTEELLESSLIAYRQAEEIWQKPGVAPGVDRRARGMAVTNAARSRGALAALVGREQPGIRGDDLMRDAEAEAKRAHELDPDDPFSALELGEMYQQRARRASERGDEETSTKSLAKAEDLYLQALGRHPYLAPARYRLGSVWEERGPGYRKQALREYQLSVEAQPTYSPPYYRLASLLREDEPKVAARYLDVYRKITPDALEIPTMPDLRGQQLEAARLRISKLGLRIGQIQASRNPAPAQTVLEQSPSPGAELVKGTAVFLKVAAPDGPSPMPDLIGMTENDALNRITLAGLTVGDIKDKEEKGRTSSAVIRQSPKARKEVSPGDSVDLTLLVPKGAKVPDLLGETEKTATKKINKKKLTLGEVGRQASCAREGTVVRQSPEKNRRVAPGSAVDLVLASPGPDPRMVPQLIGLPGERADSLLRETGLRLAQVQHQESERPKGTVLGQTPGVGTQLPAGCPVALTLAKPIPLVTVPNLVGASVDAVRRAFANRQEVFAYLRGGRISSTTNRRVPEGTVLQQSPPAGSRVRVGTQIHIQVAARATTVTPPPSKGLVIVPNVVCLPLGTAYETLTRAGLVPSLLDDREVVIRQSPTAGTRVPKGTTVKLSSGSTGRCAG